MKQILMVGLFLVAVSSFVLSQTPESLSPKDRIDAPLLTEVKIAARTAAIIFLVTYEKG